MKSMMEVVPTLECTGTRIGILLRLSLTNKTLKYYIWKWYHKNVYLGCISYIEMICDIRLDVANYKGETECFIVYTLYVKDQDLRDVEGDE